MIDLYGPTLALAGLYIGIAGLILFAFAGKSQGADQLDDEMIDALLDGDVRGSDLLKPPHGGEQ